MKKMTNDEKRFCDFYKKMCKHCSNTQLSCNEVERNGGSYFDCRFAKKLNGYFKTKVICGVCGSDAVDTTIFYTSHGNYNETKHKCANCGNED